LYLPAAGVKDMSSETQKQTTYPEKWLNWLLHNNDFAEDLLDALNEHDHECKDPENFGQVIAGVVADYWEPEKEGGS
jgi:hypothetical protein